MDMAANFSPASVDSNRASCAIDRDLHSAAAFSSNVTEFDLDMMQHSALQSALLTESSVQVGRDERISRTILSNEGPVRHSFADERR
jgi:hypothetical protein